MPTNNTDWEEFDIKGFLDDRGIPYSSGGKNVSRDFIGTSCPFCGDTSNHLGISLVTKKMTCWRCGPHHISQYIKEVEDCSWGQVSKIASLFPDENYQVRKSSGPTEEKTSCILPVGCKPKLSQSHLQYLEKRGFDPKKVIKKYNLMACNNVGNFKFRIIIPIFHKAKMVAYVGRDITGESDLKYKNSADTDSIFPVKQTLYRVEPIRDTAIIVEGIFDAWRIGKGAIATHGIQYTREQILLLKGLKKVFVMYDGEPKATQQANQLANDIGGIVPYVEVIEMQSGDPDKLPEKEIIQLKRDIGLI